MTTILRASSGRTGAAAGIAMMLLGVLLFAVNDTLGKWLVGTYTVGQLLLVRSISGLCAMAPFIARTGRSSFVRVPRPRLQLLRILFSTMETALFFWAVAELPLAEVIAYYMAGPIYVTALSPFLLGERVGWRRWTAVAVGFVGVVLALHPSPETISIGTICALTGSFSYALFLVTTRKLAGTSGTVLMTAQLVAALLFGGALVFFQGWVQPGPVDLALMLLLGIGSLGGNLCVNQSLRLAPASVVVPFQYVFFGEVIGPLTLLGTVIIVGAGLFIFVRERRLHANQITQSATGG